MQRREMHLDATWFNTTVVPPPALHQKIRLDRRTVDQPSILHRSIPNPTMVSRLDCLRLFSDGSLLESVKILRGRQCRLIALQFRDTDENAHRMDDLTTSNGPSLRFFGGAIASAVPIAFFIVWAVAICVAGAPDENGLILGALVGITLGMFLSRTSWSDYADQVVVGMANRVAAVTIVAWFWAGMFAQILLAGGLVDGLVWLGGVLGSTGGMFVGMTFLLAAVLASAVGTGYGTTVAFSTLVYPAGIALGA